MKSNSIHNEVLFKYIPTILAQTELTPGEKIIIITLITCNEGFNNKEGNEYIVYRVLSKDNLAKRSGISVRSILEILNKLKKKLLLYEIKNVSNRKSGYKLFIGNKYFTDVQYRKKRFQEINEINELVFRKREPLLEEAAPKVFVIKTHNKNALYKKLSSYYRSNNLEIAYIKTEHDLYERINTSARSTSNMYKYSSVIDVLIITFLPTEQESAKAFSKILSKRMNKKCTILLLSNEESFESIYSNNNLDTETRCSLMDITLCSMPHDYELFYSHFYDSIP